jgi:hypothetical protein
MDEALFHLAMVQEKSDNPEGAGINYGLIAKNFPFSKHIEEAKASLNRLNKPIPNVDTKVAAQNQARVKPPEGFSPLKPFIELAGALGISGQPDLYREARKTLDAEKAKAAEAQAVRESDGQAGGDIQIQDVIRKSSSSGGATASGSSSNPAASGIADKEKRKETTKSPRKKNVKKTS